MRVLGELCIGFARTGVLGYGGGPATIPLIEYEAVKKYGWMNEEEFGETLALANTLPGPIATKMAAYVGYKVKGTTGSLVAILSHIIPSLFGMLMLLGVLYSYRSSPYISGMINGVTPVVGVLLGVLAYRFLDKAKKGMGLKWMIVSVLGCLVVIETLHVHPGIVIVLFLLVAFTMATYRNKSNRDSVKKVTEKKREGA
ncbi:chromate transporter [Pseudalkalibacillus decolorationis]|uniref:chromate transporter n=1 Tax=Pseudalkalibacillus decolorationis TaxID=163879 RepID=UPI00214771C5|nr:chromate transporter [Pseudalkalibacillus decolorationis]